MRLPRMFGQSVIQGRSRYHLFDAACQGIRISRREDHAFDIGNKPPSERRMIRHHQHGSRGQRFVYRVWKTLVVIVPRGNDDEIMAPHLAANLRVRYRSQEGYLIGKPECGGLGPPRRQITRSCQRKTASQAARGKARYGIQAVSDAFLFGHRTREEKTRPAGHGDGNLCLVLHGNLAPVPGNDPAGGNPQNIHQGPGCVQAVVGNTRHIGPAQGLAHPVVPPGAPWPSLRKDVREGRQDGQATPRGLVQKAPVGRSQDHAGGIGAGECVKDRPGRRTVYGQPLCPQAGSQFRSILILPQGQNRDP